jgi:threonine/homoserine/homoserine lactone efflux protein
MGIALFYLANGRFGVDPFHSHDKFTLSTFILIFLVTSSLYILSIAIRSGRLQQRIRSIKSRFKVIEYENRWAEENLEEE